MAESPRCPTFRLSFSISFNARTLPSSSCLAKLQCIIGEFVNSDYASLLATREKLVKYLYFVSLVLYSQCKLKDV